MRERAKVPAKTSQSKPETSPVQPKGATVSQPLHAPIEHILFLQRTVGNQAVKRFLTSGTMQAKLTIGPPGDIYEQEADHVAAQVLRRPDPGQAERQSGAEYPKAPRGHRVGPEGAAEVHRQPLEEEEEEVLLQAQAAGGQTSHISPAVASHIHRLRGGGQPLPESVRAFFEPRFGQDFSQVRVHTDAQAAESAKAVQALAYTVGQDVVFSDGQYAPETASGQKLLAHELTHVVQQQHQHPPSRISRKDVPGEKGPGTQDVPGSEGELGIISSHEYKESRTFKDKEKISIASRTDIIKSPEVVHARQTPKGKEKLPYEYVLEHERRVEIETPSGDKAVLIIKANKYLPFEKLNANPTMNPKQAISLPGDFCNLRWSLDGEYGTEKFKEELFRRYGISGEAFHATGIHQEGILKPKNSRDPCSLKGLTEKTGPAFLYFNLTDRQQYEHIVDYLDGLLADRLKSEVDIRKKLEEEKKKRRTGKEEPPVSVTEEAIEAEAKGITLPGWLKGILIALGIAILVLGAIAGLAALIALGAKILVGAAFAAAFWAAFKIIALLAGGFGFVRSLIKRFDESKLSGIGDFFKKLGVSILDILSFGELIESFTDRSLITGKPLNLSEEDRWKRRTFGVLSIIGAVFGIRSWLKQGPTKSPAGGGGATAAKAMAQRYVENIFGELGGPKTGYKIQICDDATVIDTPTTFSKIGLDTRRVGGAQTDPVTKTIWVHEELLRRGGSGVVRRWGSWLNVRQVIAHELGHVIARSHDCSRAARAGADVPGLTAAERNGLLDDAVRIARIEGVRLEDLNLPPGYKPPP